MVAAPQHPRSCAACGQPAIRRCTLCKSVSCCNSTCQRQHYQGHKKECKRIARAAAAQKAQVIEEARRKYEEAAAAAVEECRARIPDGAVCYACNKGGDLVRGCCCRARRRRVRRAAVSWTGMLSRCRRAARATIPRSASRLPAATWTHDRKDLLSMDSQLEGVTVSAWAIERLLLALLGGRFFAGGVALWPNLSTFFRFRPW